MVVKAVEESWFVMGRSTLDRLQDHQPSQQTKGRIMDRYEHYIASAEWAARRQSHFNRWGNACKCCRKKSFSNNAHHLTYERLGFENDEDLMTLCGVHHQGVHEYATEHPDLTLREATFAYVREHRSSPSTRASRRLERIERKRQGRQAKLLKRKEEGFYDETLLAIAAWNDRRAGTRR